MNASRLSVLLAALVLLGSGVAGAAPERVGAADAISIISADVRASMVASASGELIPVIVTLREQADLEAITATTRRDRLRGVVRALERKAESTQSPLRAFLESQLASGGVGELTPFWIFNGLAVMASPEVIEEIAARPEVLRITTDRTIEAAAATASAPAEPNVSLVNAPALWDLGFRGQGIVVATMDTGVDVGHPDLVSSWRGGTNSWFDPNGQHPTPADLSGHGTWTMGVLVGGEAGGTAIGVAPDAQWISVKIFNDQGVATTSGIHLGFQWLLDPDGDAGTPDAPSVVSNSWSMGSAGCDLEFQLDLQGLRAAGILPVFAAGNFGPGSSTSASPANNPEAFAVGATNNADVLYSASGRGPSACGEPQAIFPELVAPGVDVRTTDLFNLYTQQSGTSLAAPHVAGALALLLDAFPVLSADAQEEALEMGAVDLGIPEPDDDHGFGRLDALASYQWLASAPDFSITAAPASADAAPGGILGYTVDVAPSGGFTGDVSLSLAGLDSSQATWAFTPAIVSGGSGSSQLAITTATSLALGTYPLTIAGASGSIVHSALVSLVVVSPQDFGLSVSPGTQTVKRGSKATSTIGVSSSGGFTGWVSLSVSGLPAGVTAVVKPNPAKAPGTSTMILKVRGHAAPGTYTIIVTGQSGGAFHQATSTLIVT